ncbi:MAG: DUF4397 domain-containing protein [Chlorobi bacterium]|nr:DUF4397 domain-containing protein [Chlorobiota bacterium]
MTRLTTTCVLPWIFFFVLILLRGPQVTVAQQDALPDVRVVHLVSDGPAFDLYLDEITPAIFQNIRYGDASRRFQTQPGLHNIAITAAGIPKETAIINQEVTANNDTSYTFLATGELSALDIQPIVLTRALNRTPAPGATLVRLFHASRSAGNVDIKITDVVSNTTSVNNFSFQSATSYQSIPEGNIRVEVSAPGGDLLYAGTGIIAQGNLLTIIASGDPKAKTFKLFVLSDNSERAKMPMDTLRAEPIDNKGLWRFVHVSPTSGDLEFTVNNTLEVDLLEYKNTTSIRKDFIAGSYNVKVSRDGDGPAAALVMKDIYVISNFYRATYAIGDVEDGTFDLLSLTDNMADSPPAGQSSMRVLNVALDTNLIDIEIEFSDGSKRSVASTRFGSFSSYQSGPAGITTVRLSRLGVSEPFLSVQGTVPSNASVTLIVLGDIESGGLEVNLLVDSDEKQQEPMTRFEPMSSVSWEREIVHEFNVLHGPDQDALLLKFALLKPTGVTVDLYDLNGKHIQRNDFGHFEQGEYVRQLDVRSILSGWHLIVMTNEKGRLIAREPLTIRR